jgi:hypothetical protein
MRACPDRRRVFAQARRAALTAARDYGSYVAMHKECAQT